MAEQNACDLFLTLVRVWMCECDVYTLEDFNYYLPFGEIYRFLSQSKILHTLRTHSHLIYAFISYNNNLFRFLCELISRTENIS